MWNRRDRTLSPAGSRGKTPIFIHSSLHTPPQGRDGEPRLVVRLAAGDDVAADHLFAISVTLILRGCGKLPYENPAPAEIVSWSEICC